MSKRKRERMKQKAFRHKEAPGGMSRPDESALRPGVVEPQLPARLLPHLADSSPEWKQWYVSVREMFT